LKSTLISAFFPLKLKSLTVFISYVLVTNIAFF
jgi:hypothetical protein